MAILTVNAGSSSLKFSVHPLVEGQAQAALLSGSIDGLEPQGTPQIRWSMNAINDQRDLQVGNLDPFGAALQSLKTLIATQSDVPALQAIAHRVVHGGREFSSSVIINDKILSDLFKLNSLAPLHQPNNLAGIAAFQNAFPDLPQVACFDTAFHTTMAEVDYSFALPQSLADQGVRRYGFHGLSYQYVIGALQGCSHRADGRVLMAHLGNGASLCGAHHGVSVTTSMGFSALDGLMMGTRCGALDAGVVLYLMEQGWDHARLQTLLYKQSGLMGVSGISADMRRLRADGSTAAKKATDLFAHRVVREAGAIAAVIGGLDVLAFSGGIGEHDAQLRTDVCQRLSWMGVHIDSELNAKAIGSEIAAIHTPQSAVEVWVIPTDEGIVVAKEAASLMRHRPGSIS